MFVVKLLTHQVGLLERSDNTWLGGCRDDGHWVALFLDPLQLLCCSRALNALRTKLLGHRIELTSNELVYLLLGHLKVVLLLESDEHVTEVVPDEVLEERIDIVLSINVVLLHHLIGEIGTCFERETLGLAEGVVTVKEDVFDLVVKNYQSLNAQFK